MKIIFNSKQELEVISIIEKYNKELEITFPIEVTYEQIKTIYDPYENKEFSEESLSRFEIYNDENQLQGVHFGYVETKDITCFNGQIKVSIKQEAEHESLTKKTHSSVLNSEQDNLLNMDMVIDILEKLEAILNQIVREEK